MKTSIEKSDFRFLLRGAGCYKVTYSSEKTGRKWSAEINDMTLIDATKNEEEPKKSELKKLKRFVKNNGYKK
jgi:hypothetical protein